MESCAAIGGVEPAPPPRDPRIFVPPVKPGFEPPLVVPAPPMPAPAPAPAAAAAADPYVFAGTDLNWLRGQTPAALYTTSPQAPVRFLFESGLSAAMDVAKFERDAEYRAAPPHIPPLNYDTIITPILKSLSGKPEAAYIGSLVQQIDAARDAFNKTGDALWEAFAANGATDSQFHRAYNLLLSSQHAMMTVSRMTDVFTAKGVAIRMHHSRLAQQIIEVAAEVADDGTDKSFPVQNMGALVGRMLVDNMFRDGARWTEALLDGAKKSGDTAFDEIAGMTVDQAHAAAARALATAREAVERKGSRLSGEDRAFAETFLMAVETLGLERAAAMNSDGVGFGIGAGRVGILNLGTMAYVLLVTYAAAMLVDILFGTGEAAKMGGGFLLGAAAMNAAARGSSEVSYGDVAVAARDGSSMSKPSRMPLEARRERTIATVKAIYSTSREIDPDGARMGLKGGVPILDDVIATTGKDAEAKQEIREARKSALDARQEGIMRTAQNSVTTLSGLANGRDVAARTSEIIERGSKGAATALEDAIRRLETSDQDLIVEEIFEAARSVFTDIRPIVVANGDTPVAIDVKRPSVSDIKFTVNEKMQDAFGVAIASSPAGSEIVQRVTRAIQENWPEIAAMTQQRAETRSKLSPPERRLRDSFVTLSRKHHRSLGTEAKLVVSTLKAIDETRDYLIQDAGHVSDYLTAVDKGNEAAAVKAAAEFGKGLLTSAGSVTSEEAENRMNERLVYLREIGNTRIENANVATMSGYEILAPRAEPDSLGMLVLQAVCGLHDKADLARVHVAMARETLGFTVYDTPGYFEAAAAASFTTLMSTKSTLGAIYHLVKMAGSAYDMWSLSAAEKAVGASTGNETDVEELKSGLYSYMTTAITTGKSTSVPWVAWGFQAICRSLFVLQSGLLIRSGWRAGKALLSNMGLEAAVATVALGLTGAAVYSDLTKKFVSITRNLDAYLSRGAIWGALTLYTWFAGSTKDLALRIRDEVAATSRPEFAESFGYSEWERIKAAIAKKPGAINRLAIAQIDAWMSLSFTFLAAFTSWVLVPAAIKVTRDLVHSAVTTEVGVQRIFNQTMIAHHTDELPEITHIDEIARIGLLNLKRPDDPAYLDALDRLGRILAETEHSKEFNDVTIDILVSNRTFADATGAALLESFVREGNAGTTERRTYDDITEGAELIARAAGYHPDGFSSTDLAEGAAGL